MERKVRSLNGYWDYSINNTPKGKIRVPYSALCVGNSCCELEFDAEKAPFAKLCFEGITYKASVTLNGVSLGDMVPYSLYEFDVTSILKEKGNKLEVDIIDMNVPFGPSEGWENYGGIIRDVYLVYMNSTHITDVVWRTKTEAPYDRADCTVKVDVSAKEPVTVGVTLSDKCGKIIASAEGNAVDGTVTVPVTVAEPKLWSPETPALYELDVTVGDDRITQKVGIKDLKIKGQRFYLNGKPTFFKGINRHDMWGDRGHTLTKEQMEADMLKIKATGCNYIRLVHYPHCRYILEIADRIGIMVSEEPGLWWSDMNNPEVTDGALEVLRRVVLRDRNHISVAFWLSFNECVFTPEFLEDSSSLCRKLDPDRPVSGANCMTIERTKELFKEHGFDFYTRHPYTYNIKQFREEAEYLNDMPLIFTEWGGYFVYENAYLFKDSLQEMINLWRNPDGEPVLAGCSYWCWADMYEFGRGRLACNEGILNEGLVDIYRNPRSNLNVFTQIMQTFDVPEIPPMEMKTEKIAASNGKYIPYALDVDSDEQKAAWAEMIEAATPQAGYVHKTKRRLTNGPALCEDIVEVGGLPVYPGTKKPVVILPNKKYTVEIGGTVKKLHFIGNVSMPWGYPAYGVVGEMCGKYILHYSDGSHGVIELRNGIEITTALGQIGPSRINPVVSGAERAISWSFDKNWEHYIANHFVADACDKKLLSVEIVSENNSTLLLYALTAEV